MVLMLTDLVQSKEKTNETFNIGVVGRVVPIKDIITAIRCFDIVRKEIPNAFLYIMGPNDEDEGIL